MNFHLYLSFSNDLVDGLDLLVCLKIIEWPVNKLRWILLCFKSRVALVSVPQLTSDKIILVSFLTLDRINTQTNVQCSDLNCSILLGRNVPFDKEAMQGPLGVHLHMDVSRAPLSECCDFSIHDKCFSLPPPNVQPLSPSTEKPHRACFRGNATIAQGGPCHTQTCQEAASCPKCWGPGTCWYPNWRGGDERPTSITCAVSGARSPPAPGWIGLLWCSVSAPGSPGWTHPFLESNRWEIKG